MMENHANASGMHGEGVHLGVIDAQSQNME